MARVKRKMPKAGRKRKRSGTATVGVRSYRRKGYFRKGTTVRAHRRKRAR